jgi:hypothetical protein
LNQPGPSPNGFLCPSRPSPPLTLGVRPLSTQSGDSSVHWHKPSHPTLCTHSNWPTTPVGIIRRRRRREADGPDRPARRIGDIKSHSRTSPLAHVSPGALAPSYSADDGSVPGPHQAAHHRGPTGTPSASLCQTRGGHATMRGSPLCVGRQARKSKRRCTPIRRDARKTQAEPTLAHVQPVNRASAPSACIPSYRSCDNEYWPTCADEYWPTLRCLTC